MKRAWVVMVLALLVVVGSYAVFAQPQQTPGRGPMGPGMMGQGGMGRGMMMQQGAGGMACPLCGMVAGGMMQKTMATTDDGGVIVALGDKLIKYDGNLNKVKEITLDIDVSQMHAKMQQMMQNCPMMQQQAGGGGSPSQTAQEQ